LNNIRIISVRESPDYKEKAILYLQNSWPKILPVIYEDCISNSLNAEQPLPQWYLLEKNKEIIGCAGLITNDFISRMDLYPWLCAIFIDEKQRGNAYGSLLIEQAKKDSKKYGFKYLNLCTDHIGYYEKYGFEYIGQGYHPWGEDSRIYQIKL
jgi:N-acetylglutamate synthase-like GNAT family acetyltransferase